jgi:myosin heavy subunit
MLLPHHTGRSGGAIITQLDRAAAEQARDACAKALYESVFLWVVRTVSDSLSTGDTPSSIYNPNV